jgi:hypothetical protein
VTYDAKQLRQVYDKFCGQAVARCRLTREVVGGQPATESGVRAFAQHHLHIPEGPELDAAVSRILREEVGEGETTPENGEVKERESYGLNVLRRDEHGPWLGDWMLKAAIKVAASRVGLFQAKRGSKGDMAEMGKVSAWGISAVGPDNQIYLRDESGENPAQTYYEKFMGRVNTPAGAKSIVNDAECAATGSRFEFRFQWYDGKLTENDMVKIFAALPVIGVGSAKALERGKFEIEELTIDMG